MALKSLSFSAIVRYGGSFLALRFLAFFGAFFASFSF